MDVLANNAPLVDIEYLLAKNVVDIGKAVENEPVQVVVVSMCQLSGPGVAY